MQRKKVALVAILLTVLFIAFTVLVMKVGVSLDSVTGKEIGLASLNLAARDSIGVNETVDQISDLVMAGGFVCIFAAFVIWFVQIFKYRSFTGVDCELYVYALLAGAVAACYILFEKFIVNYRPILENGVAEASYPSSHILFIITLLGGAMLWLRQRIHSAVMAKVVTAGFVVLMAVGTVCRILSGKHWLTDCIGAILLGCALLCWYETLAATCKRRLCNQD